MERGFNPTLAISLFEAADITTLIINGQLASEQSQARARTRMGYMGHLTLIAEEVVKFTERHPPELLSDAVLERVMSQDWINYVEGALAETRERDNAILGGVRPEVAMNNRAPGSALAAVGLSSLGSALGLGGSQSASSALAEAGLNGGLDLQGNGDAGPGPFSISAGISSGFHSSSDEEEDDADENDEDVNNEVSSRPLTRFSPTVSIVPRDVDSLPPLWRQRARDGGVESHNPNDSCIPPEDEQAQAEQASGPEERPTVDHVKHADPEQRVLVRHVEDVAAPSDWARRVAVGHGLSDHGDDAEYDILEYSYELAHDVGLPLSGREDHDRLRFLREVAARLRIRR